MITHNPTGREMTTKLTQDKIVNIVLIGMPVSIDVSTGDHDSGNRLFGIVDDLQAHPNSLHGFTLIVSSVEPNFIKGDPDAIRDAALEDAAKICEMSSSSIRLLGGEFTAQEMRSVKAVMTNRACVIRALKTGREKS